MIDDHTEAAQRTLKEKGKDADLRQLRMNLAHLRRGGDPEAIDYHTGALKAFEQFISGK